MSLVGHENQVVFHAFLNVCFLKPPGNVHEVQVFFFMSITLILSSCLMMSQIKLLMNLKRKGIPDINRNIQIKKGHINSDH